MVELIGLAGLSISIAVGIILGEVCTELIYRKFLLSVSPTGAVEQQTNGIKQSINSNQNSPIVNTDAKSMFDESTGDLDVTQTGRQKDQTTTVNPKEET